MIHPLAVIIAVLALLDVEYADFVGPGRNRRVVLARWFVATLLREGTTMSWPEIARSMGRNTHASVYVGSQTVMAALDDRGVVVRGESLTWREFLTMARREALDVMRREQTAAGAA